MADVKRRKPKAMLKDDQIRIRVTAAQKKTLTEAAARTGIGVSSWLLTVGLREASKSGGGA
jgi:uncharacterized protein (DUF1778 family)